MQVFTRLDILRHVEPNDFVISMRSFQVGIEWWSPYRGCVSSSYVPLVPADHILPGYFRYLFKSVFYIQGLQSTTNLVRDGQALRFENFRLAPLPRIPVSDQYAIAAFLDREIAKNRRSDRHSESLDYPVERKTSGCYLPFHYQGAESRCSYE